MPSKRVVDHEGDPIECVLDADDVWISVASVCRALDMDAREEMGALPGFPWATTRLAGDDLLVHLESLGQWLVKVPRKNVRPERAAKMLAYQRGLSPTLREHFYGRGRVHGLISSMGALEDRLAALLAQPSDALSKLARPAASTPTAPSPPASTGRVAADAKPGEVATLGEHRDAEKKTILEALHATNWNRVKAAERVGLPRRTFYRRLKEYGIQGDDEPEAPPARGTRSGAAHAS